MKKFLLLVIVMMALVWKSEAQNLVPNPSFEIHDSCPDNNGEIDRALGWVAVNYSPDYFHICAAVSWLSIPNNTAGYQPATSVNDSAYAGLVMNQNNFFVREIIGISLMDTLIVGQKYYVSFLTSPGYSQYHKCFCNKIGVKFSTYAFSSVYNPQNSQLMNNSAMIYADSIISDTINWSQVKGSFIADSAYTFVMLGDFFSTNTSYLCLDTADQGSYYYVDNVCVSTDSLSCFTEPLEIKPVASVSELSFSPNPTSTFLQLHYTLTQPAELMMFDALGRKVKSFILPPSQNTFELSVSELPAGIYLVAVESEGKWWREKVVKE